MDKDVVFWGKKIRRAWKDEDWFYVVSDVVNSLIDSKDIKEYIKKLRQRDESLSKGWGQIVTPLSVETAGGKQMLNCANKEGVFRIIQSIPSKKAEPFKRWLARVGSERMDEIDDPELSIDRAVKTYSEKGYSDKWISQRIKTIEVRKELTDEWRRVGVEGGKDFAILTNDITQAWSGKSIRAYKMLKNLKRENLRDNMTNLELVLNMLAEATTTEFFKKESPETFDESRVVAKKGGDVAGKTRKEIEDELGESIVSSKNSEDILVEKEDVRKDFEDKKILRLEK